MAAGLTFFAFAITQGALVTGATLAAILLIIAGAVQLTFSRAISCT